MASFLVTVGGIYLFYIVYAYLQEDITSTVLEGQSFHATRALIWIQAVASITAARLGCRLMEGHPIPFTRPLFNISWFMIASSYMGGMIFSYWSLSYISFPTNVLAKSCKMLPVFLLSILINGAKYSRTQWLSIVILTLGLIVFFQGGTSTVSKPGSAAPMSSLWQTFLGILLASASLTCDGLTGTMQDRLRHSSGQWELMERVNAGTAILLTLYLLLLPTGRGECQMIFHFITVMPLKFVCFALTSALGQVFIFATLSAQGSLVLAMATTTRKVFTILLSVLFFSHPLTPLQWTGVIAVFAGIALSVWDQDQRKRHHHHHGHHGHHHGHPHPKAA